jgi:hypothetical protein
VAAWAVAAWAAAEWAAAEWAAEWAVAWVAWVAAEWVAECFSSRIHHEVIGRDKPHTSLLARLIFLYNRSHH